MKRRIFAIPLLALMLTGLGGCGALLERSYVSVEPQEAQYQDAGSDALRAESYEGMVNAILYLISTGEEQGTLRLYDFGEDVAEQLERACLEVSQETPMGLYAVDYITSYEPMRILTYHEAQLEVRYRRTPEQIRSVVSVTGGSAIRERLEGTLAVFGEELVLRVGYFNETERSIRQMVRDAYYAQPSAAFGLPELELTLYPEEGRRRIAELRLEYLQEPGELQALQQELLEAARNTADSQQNKLPEEKLYAFYQAVNAAGAPEQGDPWAETAYGALVCGAAGEEGRALALALLCRTAGMDAAVEENGHSVRVDLEGGSLSVDCGCRDLTAEDLRLAAEE